MSFTICSPKNGFATVDLWVARLLMVSFFLGINLQAIGLVSCVGYFFFRSISDRQNISFQNFKWALLLGCGYFLYLTALVTTPKEFSAETHRLVEGRLAYLLFPLLLGLTSRQYLSVIAGQFKFFVFAAIVFCIYANLAFLLHFFILHHDDNQVINHVTYRIYFEKVTNTHPTYVSLYLSSAILMLLTGVTGLNKRVSQIAGYILLAFLLAIFAKSPILGVGIAAVHFAWSNRAKLAQFKWVIVGLLAIVVLSYLFIPFVSQRVNELVTVGAGKSHNPVADNSLNERKLIWEVDKSAIKDYWIRGCGPGKLMYELKLRYFFNSLVYKTNIGLFDPHSQYFYETIAFGLMGIILLIVSMVTHLFRAAKESNKFYFYFLILFFVTFFTESVLARQQGILFYSFFTSVLFFYTLGNKQRTTFR